MAVLANPLNTTATTRAVTEFGKFFMFMQLVMLLKIYTFTPPPMLCDEVLKTTVNFSAFLPATLTLLRLTGHLQGLVIPLKAIQAPVIYVFIVLPYRICSV